MKAIRFFILAVLLASALSKILNHRSKADQRVLKSKEGDIETDKGLSGSEGSMNNLTAQAEDQTPEAKLQKSGKNNRGLKKSLKAIMGKLQKRKGKQTHYVYSTDKNRLRKAPKASSKKRKLVKNSKSVKPERKLYYVVNKKNNAPSTTSKPAHSVLNQRTTRKLTQKIAPTPQKQTKPAFKAAPKPVVAPSGLKKSFVVSKEAANRVRKLNENADSGERKLQSIPLLLFGDYEIIIEKK